MKDKVPRKLKKKLLKSLGKKSLDFLISCGWRGKNHIAAGIIRARKSKMERVRKKTFRKVYGIANDNVVPEEQTREERFNAACERYRAMMRANEGKSFEERRDAINKFRAGLL